MPRSCPALFPILERRDPLEVLQNLHVLKQSFLLTRISRTDTIHGFITLFLILQKRKCRPSGTNNLQIPCQFSQNGWLDQKKPAQAHQIWPRPVILSSSSSTLRFERLFQTDVLVGHFVRGIFKEAIFRDPDRK